VIIAPNQSPEHIYYFGRMPMPYIKRPQHVWVKARLRLISIEEGGRQYPIISGFRPTHVFEYEENVRLKTAIGEIQFDDFELMYPGEEKKVRVVFLRQPHNEQYLTVGRIWRIQEAGKLIGIGEILEVDP
jgi:translation elongation factor EF-Tu-like GTPase